MVFVDDKSENVLAARSLGINGIVFGDLESYEREGAPLACVRLYDSVPIGSQRPSLFLDPQIEKLLQQAADKEKELLALLELNPIQIWNMDLDCFLEDGRWVSRLTDPLHPTKLT
jgi:hypothetical protein